MLKSLRKKKPLQHIGEKGKGHSQDQIWTKTLTMKTVYYHLRYLIYPAAYVAYQTNINDQKNIKMLSGLDLREPFLAFIAIAKLGLLENRS